MNFFYDMVFYLCKIAWGLPSFFIDCLQSRYDEETSALAKRRTNFERDREQMTVEDEETYNQDCENALFRIRILELRAKLHEEEAMKK